MPLFSTERRVAVSAVVFAALYFAMVLHAREPEASRVYFAPSGEAQPVRASVEPPARDTAPLHALSRGLTVPTEPASDPLAMLNTVKPSGNSPIRVVGGTSETVRGQSAVITAEVNEPVRSGSMPAPLPTTSSESFGLLDSPSERTSPADRVVDHEEPAAPGFSDMAGSSVSTMDATEEESTGSLLDRAVFGKEKPGREKKAPPNKAGFQPVLATFGGLLIVLACFFAFVLMMRAVAPKSVHSLPKEAAEHLGRIPLTGKVQLHLLRIGNRLVLLSVTADGASAITELTDADEVVQVLGACRRNDGKGSTAAFQQVLGGFLPKQADDSGRTASGHTRSGKRTKSGLDDMYTSSTDESLTSLLAAGLAKNK